MENEIYEELIKKYPFLTIATYANKEYIGIVQNSDNNFVSMYILTDIINQNEKKEFLKLSEIWWWESNRIIPINIFLKNDFKKFKKYIKTFSKKDFTVKYGHLVSMNDNIKKRIKKKQINIK